MQPRALILAAAVTLAPLAPVAAQEVQAPVAQAVSLPPGSYRQALGLNPLGIPLGFFSAEYERALHGGLSFGVGGSYVDMVGNDNGDRDTWVEAKLLYYPSESGLKGFSLGVTGGYEWAHGTPRSLFVVDDTRRSDAAPTIGVVLDYNWLLGRRKRFLVGLGVGGKRVLKNVDENTSPLWQAYPSGRLTVGYAF